MRWSCSTLQANAQTETHRTPKASIARSSTRSQDYHYMDGGVPQWPTHCTTVYTSSVTAVQHKARSRRPEPQCTALRLPTLQRRTSRRPQVSHTCKAPPPCDCLCSPWPGSACPGEHQSVSSKRHMQALRTPRARTTARTSHHSTHRTRSPTPHGTTAAGHGSKNQGATPLLCALAGSGRSARRAAAAAATCRHSSEQVFLPEELRAREVGRVGKHIAHLGGGYVEPLRDAMPDSFP